MLALEPLATHRLAAPLTPDSALTPDGRHLVYVDPESRRVWRLALDPAHCTVEVTDVGYRLPPPPERFGESPRFVQALSHDGALVALRDYDGGCVLLELPEGTVRRRVRWSYASAFSPDAHWWIRIRRPTRDEEPWVFVQDTTAGEEHDVTDRWLNEPGHIGRDTRDPLGDGHPDPVVRARHSVQSFEDDEHYEEILAAEIEQQQRLQADWETHQPDPDWVYLDNPDSLVVRPFRGDRYEVFIGCYGFALRVLVELSHYPERVFDEPGADLVFGDVVYDPVEVLAPGGERYVLAWHGYGAGLLAIDTERRVSHNFPVREVMEKSGYGAIPYGQSVAGIDTDVCAVRTREGLFLWRPGETPHRLPEAVAAPVALWRGLLLAREEEGRTLTWYRWQMA